MESGNEEILWFDKLQKGDACEHSVLSATKKEEGKYSQECDHLECKQENEQLSNETETLASEHERSMKNLIQVCFRSELGGLKRFLLSEKIKPLFSAEQLESIPVAVDFASIWELFQVRFKWYNLIELLSILELDYVHNNSRADIEQTLRKMQQNVTNYFKRRMFLSETRMMIKIDSQYEYIPESHLEKVYTTADMAVHHPSIKFCTVEAALAMQKPEEYFAKDTEQELTINKDSEELVTGRYYPFTVPVNSRIDSYRK